MHADVPCLPIEFTVGAIVAGNGIVQIVGAIGINRLIRLLRVIADPRQVMVQRSGNELISDDRLDGRHADGQLSSIMVRRPDNGSRDDFRLVDGRHRLRVPRHPRFNPIELRGIDRRELDNGYAHVAAVVNEL